MIPYPCESCTHWVQAADLIRERPGFIGFSFRVETQGRCFLELVPVDGECGEYAEGDPEVRTKYIEEK